MTSPSSLAVLTPNLAVKPSTVTVTKVTIEGMGQAMQMFGPAQAAVAKAVADSVADGEWLESSRQWLEELPPVARDPVSSPVAEIELEPVPPVAPVVEEVADELVEISDSFVGPSMGDLEQIDFFIDQDPRDGMMDDLNGDGEIDIDDAMVLYGIIDDLCGESWFEPFTGGLGKYGPNQLHGPFVHVDVRGCKARW